MDVVKEVTGGWGVDMVFEASGNEAAIVRYFRASVSGWKSHLYRYAGQTGAVDIVAAQAKEARMETIFRYAHVYPSAVSLLSSGKIDVKPLITDRYKFEDSIKAYEYAA